MEWALDGALSSLTVVLGRDVEVGDGSLGFGLLIGDGGLQW